MRWQIVLPVALLLTACSTSDQSSASADVNSGCQVWQDEFKSNGFTSPILSMRYFAEAARKDSGYLPLSQAAAIASDSFERLNGIGRDKEWIDAVALINGVCFE